MTHLDYEELLLPIERYWLEKGYPPTRRVLLGLWGVKSLASVTYRLFRMAERGLVRIDNGRVIPVKLLNKIWYLLEE
uniref:Putative transcriptional repressor n=1 Tax=viral metagenome TaxID=1070528 RepID=A0A6H1ZAL3_9ZZZZ